MISSEMVYYSDFVTVFNDTMMLPDESTIAYKRVELSNFCSVLPLVEDRKIAMIDIYRYPANSVSREIPSGFIEKNEDPRAAALRELKEETGYTARTLRNWGWFYPWTRSTQKAYIFLAEDVVKGRSMPDRAEQIRVKLFTIDEAKKMLALGKITHPPTIIALQKLLLYTK